jgi:hypothetical protein
MPAEEFVYPPPQSKRDTPSVDAVRGFVFSSGLRWMEQRQLTARYNALLPPDLQRSWSTRTTAEWIPLADALRTYEACDALGLSVADQIDLGRFVSAANNGVVVATMVRLLGKLGATPWTALRHVDRVWKRSNRGGAVAVFKLGERAARLEIWKCGLASSPFFVTSMRGAIGAGMDAFCARAIVTEVPGSTTADGFSLKVTW